VDVAGHVKTEDSDQVLRASEARYRTLFEESSDGIIIADLETRTVQHANPAAVRMLGHESDSDLRGLGVTDLHPREVLPSVVARLETLSRGERAAGRNIPFLRKDGTVVHVDMSAAIITMDGRTMVVGFLRDATELERAEMERARLATAIEQAAEAVVITDVQGAISYVNPAFETVTGYSRAEVIGRNPRVLKSGAQDEAFYRGLWATITGGNTWRGKLVNKKKNGTLYTEEATISPVRDAAGTITSYVAVKRDITATLALEAQFLQAQKMEAVGRLAGGVAHDFNNVLSVILSYAEMIGSELQPDEPVRADVEEIRTAALRAAGLSRQLLAFSRRQVFQKKVLDVRQVLVGMEKMLVRLLGADIHLTMVPAPGLWNIEADPAQVEQIIMNLAVNARDAMPHGGHLTIEMANVELDEDYASVHADVRAGPFVQIAVSDTGTGMDQEIQARIFEPFFTTKAKGKGTGLGLATVFGIVKQSGGHIWVYSEPGKGSSFKLHFPKAGAAAATRSWAPVVQDVERGNETILLVEDEDQVRSLARRILQRHGYVVLDASNGGEALLICEQHQAKIHLLLTDVVLPRMNGRQLAERLASLRPEMKTLFMSGYADDAILQHGILDSDVAFLQKPFTPGSLTRKVGEVLREETRAGG
jgi:PAS domain S-box-containing protein